MFKFFRKIRYQILDSNKTGRYFKYAFGEIILVVIGILIALQINNWNENRKTQTQELELLKSLKTEFEINLVRFDSIMKHHELKEDYLFQLINYDKQKIALTELDQMIYEISYSYTTNLSTTIQTSIVNSGTIEIISNDALKNRIGGFLEKYHDFEEDEITSKNLTFNSVLPFLDNEIKLLYSTDIRSASEIKRDEKAFEDLLLNYQFRNRIIHLKGMCWDITTEGKIIRQEMVEIVKDLTLEINS